MPERFGVGTPLAREAGTEILPSDEALVAASKAEGAIFGAIFDRYADDIYRYIARRLGGDAAPDLAAEVFLIAFGGRGGFDPARGLVRPWLYGIAIKVIGRHRRAEIRRNRALAIRAALYRVIEGLPGIRYLGPVTDRLGRHGIGVGLTHGGARQELFFDPATSRALEEQIVATAPKQDGNNYQPTGTVLLYTVFVTSGVVNSAAATLPAASGSPSGSG
jgi:DNA-directed RNA polymerase specialized sigma24 family protein